MHHFQTLWHIFHKDHSNGLREIQWMIQSLILPRRHTSFFERLRITDQDGFWKNDTHPVYQNQIRDLRRASVSRRDLLQYIQTTLDEDEQGRLTRALYDRTIRRKPLQYILRTEPFCSINVIVRPPTLIPRVETAEWCSSLIQVIQDNRPSESSIETSLRILDLCSGSGCISLSLAQHLPQARILGIDLSSRAIRLAKLNQRRLGIRYSANMNSKDSSLSFIEGDMLNHEQVQDIVEKWSRIQRLEHKHGFDVIVSNPPYIAMNEKESLDKSVTDWEDPSALFAGHDSDEHGISFYRHLQQLLPLLSSRLEDRRSVQISSQIPLLVMEIGESQGEIVSSLFQHAFPSLLVKTRKDLFGRHRSIWVYLE